MKAIMKILVGMLVLCMVFGLCSCANGGSNDEIKDGNDTENVSDTAKDSESEEETTEAKPEFKVTVTDENGAPVEGVMVQICKDSCIPARTDANGVAVFNMEITDGCKLSVMTAPAGYTYSDEEIYLESGATEYTLEISSEVE